MHKGFKDEAYTNNPDSTINNFYLQLFTHQINFAFDLDKEHKQMKEEMQRKIACDKYEASSTLMTLALSAQDQHSTKYEMHVEEEEEETEGGEAVTEAASLLMEVHGLNTEMILACTTHMLGSSEGLILFGDGPNTKALAFTINNSSKELICWHFNKHINRLITFKPSSQILYTRCTIYWCSRTITYFNKAYSFIKRQRMQIDGLMLEQTYSYKYLSTWHGLQTIAQKEGWRTLFRGLHINYIKVVPLVSVSFTINDLMRRWMGLKTEGGVER
ncbi:carrier superfamily protein [Acanthamoeba castellanii str. Neff]|uniref:Carrier superfamily protein n=1 Tax=Acanthamoeba castellanii (strain ATCC 30010 / Neff) TaxID=1257118 RepID=L8GNW5_ACACF|nr:carrier superfamily protein [Acanthamoeba castellanii str. Neff]ELR14804.1 carrier superfamily protein [Acanthamoeba castellanii str. Neff]